MSIHTVKPVRELDHRLSDGVDVRMLWCELTGVVTVAVNDARTGRMFWVDVREDERAADVFHHPFAYAAFRGIDTGCVSMSEDDEFAEAA